MKTRFLSAVVLVLVAVTFTVASEKPEKTKSNASKKDMKSCCAEMSSKECTDKSAKCMEKCTEMMKKSKSTKSTDAKSETMESKKSADTK